LNKILIIQTASLGDVVLATPLIEKLHYQFPHSHIDFLLKNGNEDLLRKHPKLRHLLIWDKSKNKYSHLFKLLKIIRKEKYDLVVDVHRFASSGLLTAFSGAKHRVGFNKNPFSLFFTKRIQHKIASGNTLHETGRNLKLIESFTDNTFFAPKLYPSKRDYAFVSQFKTSAYITVSPASLWFTKQFPVEKWMEFIRELDKKLIVYFLGSSMDKELCNIIINGSEHQNNLNLTGKLTLLQSAALMHDAQINYTNDSAPMHLASAVNGPIAAIFCSTVPAFGFGPLSERSFVIETKTLLPCRPCGLHGRNKCPENHFVCAYSINKKQLQECL